ncbi:hypothetical protein [Sulfurimonas sp.]|uniref:hypothetical protein n=1 Tax=Sulfurimonas sp. TaxID=2022749 RepID=UPI0026134866|nr:hypothetical protein [Sulfurimonas sp.]
MVIIASFLLSLSACGYKANPYYEKKAPQGDENVDFFIQKQKMKNDNNESCR